MQSVAREMNLAETAFLHGTGESWSLRWFTPQAEVDLCGHATLASAQVLWEIGALPADQPAAFDTRSGRLSATRRGPWIEMDFPLTPVEHGNPGELLAALNAPGVVVGHKRNRMDYLVELVNEQAVREIKPNIALLATLPVRGVIVTARSDTTGIDFVSRFFAPSVGVSEDPVTGSAHCCLAPYWGEKLGKRRIGGIPGVVARRHRAGRAGGQPGAADRPGRYGAARGTARQLVERPTVPMASRAVPI